MPGMSKSRSRSEGRGSVEGGKGFDAIRGLRCKRNRRPRVCGRAVCGSSRHHRLPESGRSICPSSFVIRKQRAAKLYFFACENDNEVNKIDESGPRLAAIWLISDCQPLNNELQRIHDRGNQLMKLSLSLVLLGAFLFSACEDEPPVRSTRRHPSGIRHPLPKRISSAVTAV